MLIKDLFKSKKPVLSFEIFPPKKDSDIDVIYSTIEGLKDMNPDFISVTYGAGGSTRSKTVEIASIVKNKYNIEALAHLTSVGLDRNGLLNILNEFKENNIENILALRGDMPKDMTIDDFQNRYFRYSSNIISEIKENEGFSIGGACYPEMHPESSSLEKDIEALKIKQDCGADFLVTQLFFDNEKMYNFMDRCASKGITLPVTAGIMPVTNKNQIERMIALSNATIPSSLSRILEKYENDAEALREAGIAFATEQIVDLISWGIGGIHLYTMNRPETCKKILGNINHIL